MAVGNILLLSRSRSAPALSDVSVTEWRHGELYLAVLREARGRHSLMLALLNGGAYRWRAEQLRKPGTL